VNGGVLAPSRLIELDVTAEPQHTLRLARLLVRVRRHRVGQTQRLCEQAAAGNGRITRHVPGRERAKEWMGRYLLGDDALGGDPHALDVERF
jgi:hypothetical protein